MTLSTDFLYENGDLTILVLYQNDSGNGLELTLNSTDTPEQSLTVVM